MKAGDSGRESMCQGRKLDTCAKDEYREKFEPRAYSITTSQRKLCDTNEILKRKGRGEYWLVSK